MAAPITTKLWEECVTRDHSNKPLLGDKPSKEEFFHPGLSSATYEDLKKYFYDGGWKTGLYACDTECSICVRGAVMPCCVVGDNAESQGLSKRVNACMYCTLFPLGLCGCVTAPIRQRLRTDFTLPATCGWGFCGDFITHTCCAPCAVCQDARELHLREGQHKDTRTLHKKHRKSVRAKIRAQRRERVAAYFPQKEDMFLDDAQKSTVKSTVFDSEARDILGPLRGGERVGHFLDI